MPVPYATDDLYAATVDLAPQIIDKGIRKETVLWDRLMKSFGPRPQWQVQSEAVVATAGFEVGAGESLPVSTAAKTEDLELYWGNYHAAVKFADRDLRDAAVSGGRLKIRDMVQFQLQSAAEEIAGKLSIDAVSGSTHDSKKGTIIGLRGGMIEDTGSYAGLSRATTPGSACHAAYVDDNGGTPRALTETLLRNAIEANRNRGGSLTVLFCGSGAWHTIAGFTGVSETKNDVGPGLSKFVGATSIEFHGLPVVNLPNYGTGRVEGLDESYLGARILPAGAAPNAAGIQTSQFTIENMVSVLPPEQKGDTWEINLLMYVQLWLREQRKRAISVQDLNV